MDNREENIPKRFYSDRFDVEQTSNLSLFLYTRSLVIMAKDKNGSVIGTHLYTFVDRKQLSDIISGDRLINADNTVGKLYVHNDLFCLVPSVLFDPSLKSTYINFIGAADKNLTEIFYEGVDSNNIQVVGAIEKEIIGLLDDALPDLEITHGASLVLSYLFKDINEMLGQEVFVFAEENNIYLAAFAGSELKVFNRFSVSNGHDLIKYILTVMHQLAFDRVHCRISLFGDFSMGVELEDLKLYVKNIVTLEPRFNQTYSPGAETFKGANLLEAFCTT
ncbi:MAG TPA: DUF3822 family protein [Cyclobacteriaceae bacterium]|nr:DUF3822 family protein [Cyclobacteriaceae bacterium]